MGYAQGEVRICSLVKLDLLAKIHYATLVHKGYKHMDIDEILKVALLTYLHTLLFQTTLTVRKGSGTDRIIRKQ